MGHLVEQSCPGTLIVVDMSSSIGWNDFSELGQVCLPLVFGDFVPSLWAKVGDSFFGHGLCFWANVFELNAAAWAVLMPPFACDIIPR